MKIATRPPRSIEVNMLPMINIIFLLLVFVVLTGAAVRLPDTTRPEEAALVAAIGRDGVLSLEGRSVSVATLAAQLRQLRRPLRLSADPDLTAASLVRVLETLRGAGIEQADLRMESR